jgi:glutaredoxin
MSRATLRIPLTGILIVSCWLSVGQVHAQVYKWVDDDGITHFSDTPPQSDSDFSEIEVKVNSYTSTFVEETPIDNQGDKIVMYSTSWCGYCKKARRYFDDNNIAFVEYDIEKSPKARKEYDALGGRGVPVILVGNRKLTGFSVDAFEKLYN